VVGGRWQVAGGGHGAVWPGSLAGASLALVAACRIHGSARCTALVLPLVLQGNRQAYYEASNSLLHEVLTKREGIPISLAVLHQAVSAPPGGACLRRLPAAGLPGWLFVLVAARMSACLCLLCSHGSRAADMLQQLARS
jgi:hypothetical protein